MEKTKQSIYLILIFATIADIILLFYVSFYPTSLTFKNQIHSFDMLLCVILWIEFFYSYSKSDNKRQYLKENSLSILGMLPINFVFLRALRLVKLLQLIKLLVLARDHEKNLSNFLKNTYLDKIILVLIIFTFILALSIQFADPHLSDPRTAFWYILVTITSTGYGDIVPSTLSGQVIGVFAMIGGILIFATFTAVISSLYVSKISSRNHDDLNSKIEDLTCEIEKLNKKIDDLEKE